MEFKVFDKPHIFKTRSGRWVAVYSVTYTEYAQVFTPVAEADTLAELGDKLKPSLLTRIKRWIKGLV